MPCSAWYAPSVGFFTACWAHHSPHRLARHDGHNTQVYNAKMHLPGDAESLWLSHRTLYPRRPRRQRRSRGRATGSAAEAGSCCGARRPGEQRWPARPGPAATEGGHQTRGCPAACWHFSAPSVPAVGWHVHRRLPPRYVCTPPDAASLPVLWQAPVSTRRATALGQGAEDGTHGRPSRNSMHPQCPKPCREKKGRPPEGDNREPGRLCSQECAGA